MGRKKRNKVGIRIVSFILVLTMLLMNGCSGGEEITKQYTYKKESEDFTRFSSSDSDLDFFMNDYFRRHVGVFDDEEGDTASGDHSGSCGCDSDSIVCARV